MPFTLSHPSLVLPVYFLKKRYFSLTALVLGSMIPDIKFFTNIQIIRTFSHNWITACWIDLPIALLLCFAFQNVIREPLIHYSPAVIYNRFQQYEKYNWNKYFIKNWLIVILSLVIGIYSHLVLDRFTHFSFYMFSLLTGIETVLVPENDELIYYRVIQSMYSTIGLLIEAFIIWKLPVVVTTKNNINISVYWSTTLGLSAMLYLTFGPLHVFTIEGFLGFSVASLFMGLFFTSIVFKAMMKRLRNRTLDL